MGNTGLLDELHEPLEQPPLATTLYTSAPPILAFSLLSIPSPKDSSKDSSLKASPENSPKPLPKYLPKDPPQSPKRDQPKLLPENPIVNLVNTSLRDRQKGTIKYLPTSCHCIDHDALAGGFLYGQINSLSGENPTERALIAIHAVITHLFSHPDAQAAWIDSEGTFSPIQLKEAIVSRLPLSETSMTVENILNRVQVMRVFDVHGLIEVVEEFTQSHKVREQERRHENLKKVIVNDSQEDSDNESLEKPESERKPKVDFKGIGVVVIDIISQSLSEVRNIELEDLEKEDDWAEMDKPEAAALLVDFFKSFSLLARDQNICVLFLNSIDFVEYDSDPYIRSYEISSSLFPFTEFKPSLGPLHTQYIDLSVLLSKQPHQLEAADLLEDDMDEYSLKEHDATLEVMAEKVKLLGWEEDFVIEVLGDRYGSRSRSWGTFRVEGVKLIDVLPQDTTDTIALMALEPSYMGS